MDSPKGNSCMTLQELITIRSVIDTVTPRNSKEISDLTEAKRILDRDIKLRSTDPRTGNLLPIYQVGKESI